MKDTKQIELHTLRRWFRRECDRRELDPQIFDFEGHVDPALTYYENKAIIREQLQLASPIIEPDYDPAECDSALEAFMKEHALTYYILCKMDGETESEEVGPVWQHRFSLKDYIRFLG